jgi:hypothetical protein
MIDEEWKKVEQEFVFELSLQLALLTPAFLVLEQGW